MNLAERIKLVLNETGLNKSQFASKIIMIWTGSVKRLKRLKTSPT